MSKEGTTILEKVLNENNHVLRIVRSSQIEYNQQLESIYATPDAFMRRKGEPAISVVWVEYFRSGQFCNQLYQAACSLGKVWAIKQTTTFAYCNVGAIKRYSMANFGMDLRITVCPTSNNKAHSRIYVPINHDEFFEQLAIEPIFKYITMRELEKHK